MKMGNHLKFYEKSMLTGRMVTGGLCDAADSNLISAEILKLFKPSHSDILTLVKEETLSGLATNGFWGCGLSMESINRSFTFTPLRQTIVLFMAAINNEL